MESDSLLGAVSEASAGEGGSVRGKRSSAEGPASAELADFTSRIETRQLFPLWERLEDLLPVEPVVKARPHIWRHSDTHPLLLESGRLIGELEAERRVLILENPGLAGESSVCESLFAGLQVLMPGEVAPPHRHSPAALRFILDSRSGYTTVNEEKVDMKPGDLILTPSWTWHGHHNEGEEPVIWLDVLDLPAVRSLGPRFAEHRNDVLVDEGSRDRSLLRYGMNMAPVDADESQLRSPLRYAYTQSREVLDRLVRSNGLHAAHGAKMEYANPTNGGPVLPSISAYLQLLPEGFTGERYRTTEGAVYCVVEGNGSVVVDSPRGRFELEYRPKDIFVIPCWHRHAFSATRETVLFSAGNRAAQACFGLWRAVCG
jgi:gentisate 1,2-dioxygenase